MDRSETNPPERDALDSPFCKHLRSKRWYFRTGPPQVARDLLDSSNHSWCGVSCEIQGHDGEMATPEFCVRGRACFEPYFADSPATPSG
jgi:hypothetical protein